MLCVWCVVGPFPDCAAWFYSRSPVPLVYRAMHSKKFAAFFLGGIHSIVYSTHGTLAFRVVVILLHLTLTSVFYNLKPTLCMTTSFLLLYMLMCPRSSDPCRVLADSSFHCRTEVQYVLTCTAWMFILLLHSVLGAAVSRHKAQV